MGWKDFLKPTEKKLGILFLIWLILYFSQLYFRLLYPIRSFLIKTRVLKLVKYGVGASGKGEIIIPSSSTGLMITLVIVGLLFFIPGWVISCLVIWIYERIKKGKNLNLSIEF